MATRFQRVTKVKTWQQQASTCVILNLKVLNNRILKMILRGAWFTEKLCNK